MAGDVEGSVRGLPIACTLSAAEQAGRREEATRVLFAGCRKVSELEDGYAYEFPGGDEQIEALTRFVVAERECCTFFTFELTFEPDRGPVHLRMRGPRGTKEFIRGSMDEGFVRRHGIRDKG